MFQCYQDINNRLLSNTTTLYCYVGLCCNLKLLTTCKAAWHMLIQSRLCVGLSDNNFRQPWRRKFIFAHAVHLQGIPVKFVYKGQQVKIKVTASQEPKRSKIPILAM